MAEVIKLAVSLKLAGRHPFARIRIHSVDVLPHTPISSSLYSFSPATMRYHWALSKHRRTTKRTKHEHIPALYDILRYYDICVQRCCLFAMGGFLA